MTDFHVSTLVAALPDVPAPLLAIPLFAEDREPPRYLAELDRRLDLAISQVLERGDFLGRPDDVAILYPGGGQVAAERILLVGCGKREEFTAEQLRRAAGAAVRQAERLGVRRLAVSLAHTAAAGDAVDPYLAARSAAEGAGLAAWEFRELKSRRDDDDGRRPPVEAVTLVSEPEEPAGPVEQGARDGAAHARAANLARELATLPGNHATPSYLADVARGIADRNGLKLTVLDRDGMAAEGLHALLAVARGSQEPPKFLVLEYHGGEPGAPPLALVGKGLTFDSGGISLKPSERMEDMKYDMSGGAAVLAAVDAVAALESPVNLVAVVPCTENLPSGTALKPGDVIRSHAGKTIEVINTDAEGRLILADALSYAVRHFRPAAMVDVATLTGSVVVALGNHAVGLLSDQDDLAAEIGAAGERAGERCWRLPLWKEYREQIDSDVADIKNTGGRPAGTITAAWFLREFAGDTPWAHLDIAGTAWRTESLPSYLRKGATGVPARLLIEWVRSRAES